jgi:HAD superfamily hydrolase (TIGR01509 family)
MGGDKLLPHVAGIDAASPEGERLAERRGEIFLSRYLPHLQPFPRVRELLERLARDGFRLVVATSARERELAPLLERAGVADLIARATSSDDAERSKPDPDIVAAALRRSKAPASAAVMIGDTPYDVEAATRAGVQIVAVECGGWRRQELAGALDVYSSPADILERYEYSVFAELRREHAGRAGSTPGIDLRGALYIAAGVAGVALLALMVSAIRRRAAEVREESADGHRHAGLGPRDRERLRHIIERTS